MKKISLVSIIITLALNFSNAQTNGYSLEFEDVITLSADTAQGPPNSTSWSSSFTVPSGQVLKITGGWISSGGYSTSLGNGYSWISSITINNLRLYSPVMGPNTEVFPTNPSTTGASTSEQTVFKISHDSPIWVSSGKTVAINVSLTKNGSPTSNNFRIQGCWITGVLFKKVPN